MFSTISTDYSTIGVRKKHGVHILFHTSVENTVERFEYSLYIVDKSGNSTTEHEMKGGFPQ